MSGTALTMQVRAAIATASRAPLRIETIDLAEPRAGEVLVRLVASGLCHTDITMIDHVPLPWPAVLGHEGVGIVERVGAGVTRLAPGDHVVMTTTGCGACATCRGGNPSYCARFEAINMGGGARADGSCTHSQNGRPVFGRFFGQSSFAAYAIAEERNAFRVDPALPLAELAPLACGVQTGVGAVLNTLHAQAGRSLAVFGVGAVGLSALMAAKISGCVPLIAIDTRSERLALARELGATRTIDAAREDAVALLQSDGGIDYAVEAAGSAAVMGQAIAALGIGGAAVLIGLAPGQSVSFDPGRLQARGQTILGTLMAGNGAQPEAFLRRLVEYWQGGLLPIEKLVRYYRFDNINRAIEDARSGAAIKPVLLYNAPVETARD